MVDVSGDGLVSPIDVLLVTSHLDHALASRIDSVKRQHRL